jgi:riboflavin biosynthesis pyrimidine reductase
MHVTWYTAMSMDGRIAGVNDSLDFLATINGDPGADDHGFSAFLATVDGVVVGANTLRWLLRGGHGWPHGDLPTWLISHDGALIDRVGATEAPFTRVEGEVKSAFDEIAAAGHQRVWLCGGGDLAGQALMVDKVDQVTVTIAPTVLGAGPSLFHANALPMRRFHLTECRAVHDAAHLTWVREAEAQGPL